MRTSFYTDDELAEIGLKKYGKNVLISKKASLYNPEKISIGNHVRIDDFSILSGSVQIGDYVHIAAYNALYGKFGIELQDYSGISARCTILSASDDFTGKFLIGPTLPERLTNVTGGKVILEKYVQIGTGSVIMPDIKLCEGSIVGSMSFVKRSLEQWKIYAGNPLKYIKDRDRSLLLLAKKINE